MLHILGISGYWKEQQGRRKHDFPLFVFPKSDPTIHPMYGNSYFNTLLLEKVSQMHACVTEGELVCVSNVSGKR